MKAVGVGGYIFHGELSGWNTQPISTLRPLFCAPYEYIYHRVVVVVFVVVIMVAVVVLVKVERAVI